ncbi:hypothetical protein MVES1_000003 [Malassezia vespertilionis]|uniref:Uncharacterized protein n=1 Tax=Malassezia vespertilionis TaxID=2020962 RepID=A0A2N1JGC4_9BASI|nr:uncharacterized protein MVES1_000003 [Malassezia vespertilionis]PKI85604.1 hypothetical protein MVES_000004 [Malassezia vespertilionis]WFD04680.1 hypothetical protein MVES1_000003 [Malassezia vespertilionis]
MGHLRENGVSPSRAPAVGNPYKPMPSTTPFKRADVKSTPSRTGRVAFGDKTNQSPSPARRTSPLKRGFGSPSKPQGSRTDLQQHMSERPFTRHLVTPAGNIGRADQNKARMSNLYPVPPVQETTCAPPADALCEEDTYPPIEYMPPHAPAPRYTFPAELDGMPRAAEAHSLLSSAPRMGFDSGGANGLLESVAPVPFAPMPSDPPASRSKAHASLGPRRTGGAVRDIPRRPDFVHDALAAAAARHVENTVDQEFSL